MHWDVKMVAMKTSNKLKYLKLGKGHEKLRVVMQL